MRSKQAAEQAEKRRLEKRKNKLAKATREAQVHVNIHTVNIDTESNTEVATTVDSEAPNEPIHEINVSNPVMPNDNLSMMSSDSMEAWAFRTDLCEPDSKSAKKLNRFGKAVAVEIAEADDNANITVLPDNNATYDESISNSIAFACGYDARYENTYQSTQLESDSESDSEEDFQSPHIIPNGSSGDEYFSTEE